MPIAVSAAATRSIRVRTARSSAITLTVITDNSPDEAGIKPPVALIAGPTASGKSGLAVRLAQELAERGKRAVVINADSAQVYRDLHVLSARPSPQEMEGIEHRLYGTWDGAIACSAADWARAAKREIAALHGAGAIPILCGGTGMYIRTLLDGIAPIPAIDPNIRADIRAMPQTAARAALERDDPEAAARLAPADNARTCRALEVVRSTGKPMAHWHANMAGGIGPEITLHPLRLLPDRATLFARCDLRFERMLEDGAGAEVAALLARKLDPDLPVMRAIGVREIIAFLDGASTEADMIAAAQLATRQYAKRQFTWFRNQPPKDWPSKHSDDNNLNVCFETLFHSVG